MLHSFSFFAVLIGVFATARPDLVKELRAELDAWWTPRE
jgi:hypothetical protein